ncbi:F-box only protein 22-like [Anneissia japonica]|uniref:F-box only protein 22-like n=1 Tax=Anneissia japonica TaxID=1529436 RepID=UPI00142592B1|nr:F-box only protein 22-like [Anneissia japonica]
MEVLNESDIINEEEEEEKKQQANPPCKEVTYVMTELHEFLKQVFERLPARSLLRCSRVCKRWKSVATLILKARESFTWAQYNSHIWSREDERELPVPYILGYFGLDLNICLQEAWSVPTACLLLTEFKRTSDFHGTSLEEASGVDVDSYVSSLLPSSCQVVAVTVPGTVCTTRDLTNCAESEGEGGAVAILFPEMNGARITRFSIRNNLGGNIWEQSGIERHEDVKCILTFTPKTSTARKLAGEKLQEAFFKDGQTPVIAGAIVDHVLRYVVVNGGKSTTECIVFSGERISAASVLLDQDAYTEELVHKELMRLKSAGLSEKNSIGLMFACIGRGCDFYSAWDVESKVFRTLFPKTPLFGLFGNGEIGCTNLPQSKWKNLPEMAHGYTTIMCLISFG